MSQKNKDYALTGAAGVFHVASVFSLRGMIALPTIRNTAGYDIIVTSSDGTRHANIQVKTAGGDLDWWRICMKQKIEKVRTTDNDYYVLLRRGQRTESFEFEGFMLTGKEMKTELDAYIKELTDTGKTAQLASFPLCLNLDNGERTQLWRKRWQTWTLKDTDAGTSS